MKTLYVEQNIYYVLYVNMEQYFPNFLIFGYFENET